MTANVGVGQPKMQVLPGQDGSGSPRGQGGVAEVAGKSMAGSRAGEAVLGGLRDGC